MMNFMSTLLAVAERVIPNSILYRLRAHRSKARGHNPELALLPILNDGGIFLDIGANIGDFSRVACLIFRQVEAFEPIPELASKLKAELPKNVTVHVLALSEAHGSSTLYVPVQDGRKITGLASLDPIANRSPEMTEIAVEMRTLDSFGFSGIDVIKIDVEGFEEFVLKGASETLRTNRPALIVEIEDRHHPGKTVPVFEILWDLGFDAFYYMDGVLYPVARPDGEPKLQEMNRSHTGEYVYNFVFLHPKRRHARLASLIHTTANLSTVQTGREDDRNTIRAG